MATSVHDLAEANASDSSQDVSMVGECELYLTSNLSLSDFEGNNIILNWQRVDKTIVKINKSLSSLSSY